MTSERRSFAVPRWIAAMAGFALGICLLAGPGVPLVPGEAAGAIGNFTRVAQPSVTPGRPVTVFLLSALYCPFCAAERWALVDALGRFGTWSSLAPAESTSGVEGFSAIPTYNFVHARYTSRWVAFTARDVQDAQGRPLQPLAPNEAALVNRFDPDGGIPFLLIAGAFAEHGSGYSPGLLVHKSFDQVRSDLAAGAPDGAAIRHEADIVTALICFADKDTPATACGTPAVRTMEAQFH